MPHQSRDSPAEEIATFTSAAALDALAAALAAAGVAETGALRLLQPPTDNAVVHVPALGLIARIAATTAHRDRLGRELETGAWLHRNGIDAARPASDPPTPQLTVVNSRVLSWWEHLDATAPADYAGLGRLLARLHALPAPAFLPRLDPWSRIPHLMALAGQGLPEADFARLQREYARLGGALAASSWADGPAGPVHGDAHLGNTLDLGGRAHLIDFEDMAAGPVLWDVATIFNTHQLGWLGDADWTAFTTGYGSDPTGHPDIELLGEVLALRRTVWLAARTGREPRFLDTVRGRIDTFDLPLAQRHW
ncbi:aminoglycoside phosphotransferase family protein [Glycomyces scopariae]